jgi:uncharacterized sulfatase
LNRKENPVPTQPNFVIIFGETQGANIIGAFGHRGVQTPNTDRLAKTSTFFTRGYTTCPLCTPARAGLFSGIYSHSSGAWTNNLPLGDNIQTMGQRFQDAGYHTVYTGKWHLDGHDYFGKGQCPDGWDKQYWYDGKRYLADLTEDEIYLWRKGLGSLEALQNHGITTEFTWGHRITNRAIDFLQERKPSQPFLLIVAPDEPHHPFICPPEYVERFQDFHYPLGPAAFDTLENKPAHQREWAAASRQDKQSGYAHHPLYFGCNSFIDHQYGRLIEAVERYAPENTYIVLTTDHGEMGGAHQLLGKGPAMYEEITHVPFIIRQPGGKRAGMVNPTPVSHIDIMPTLLDLAGLEIPPILEGSSLRPFLEGVEDPARKIVIEFNRYEIEHDSWGGFQPIRCLVAGQYKLVLNLLHTDELYDLKHDPAELDNLINDPDYAQIRDQMHTHLIDWMNDKRDPFRGPTWERRPWSNTNRLMWMGKFRPRPADGYAPEVRDYDTGMPSKGVKVEHE